MLPILYMCSNHADMGSFFEFTHLYAIFLLFASHLSLGRMFTACERSQRKHVGGLGSCSKLDVASDFVTCLVMILDLME